MKSYGSDLPNMAEIEQALDTVLEIKNQNLHREIFDEGTITRKKIDDVGAQHRKGVETLIMEKSININRKLTSLKRLAIVNFVLLIINVLGVGGLWAALYFMFVNDISF